jgi:hypothetical protein
LSWPLRFSHPFTKKSGKFEVPDLTAVFALNLPLFSQNSLEKLQSINFGLLVFV